MREEVIKLDRFTSEIMSEVSDKKKKIELEVQSRLEKDYQEKELQYLEEAYSIIQDGLKKVDREKNEEISKTLMENKIRLLSKRNEIIQEVFKRAQEKIVEYTQTDEYHEEMVKRIKDHMKFMGEGKYIIYINYKEKEMQDYYKKQFPDAEIKVERKSIDMLGGCKLHNTTSNMYIDDSYAKRLEEERGDFLQYCGIKI